MIDTDIPLFPLGTVLFPGGHLPLRIFERRYIDMVRECSSRDICFGVCLINNPEGSKTPATHHRMGTMAKIIDFSTLEDGLLGIVASGQQKFVIQKTRMRDNGLLMARVQALDEESPVDMPDQYSVLSMITGRFMEQLGKNYATADDIAAASKDALNGEGAGLFRIGNELDKGRLSDFDLGNQGYAGDVIDHWLLVHTNGAGIRFCLAL